MTQQNFIEIVPVVFAAGESRLFHVSGSYFELIDATNPVDVVLSDVNGSQRGRMLAAEASFNLKNTEFNTIQITSATAQNVRFAFGSGEAGTRRAAGSVNVANVNGPFTQAGATVTTASAQLLAARTSRRYLLIQNKDATGDIYVNVTGVAAAAATGILVPAGGSLELAGFCPTAAIFAIGTIASNANITVVEG